MQARKSKEAGGKEKTPKASNDQRGSYRDFATPL